MNRRKNNFLRSFESALISRSCTILSLSFLPVNLFLERGLLWRQMYIQDLRDRVPVPPPAIPAR